jgi:hypothetical protein
MSKVGVASLRQQDRHARFVASLRFASPYALANRYSDGGPGRRRHRSRRVGGRAR